jgi:hypothetical protein
MKDQQRGQDSAGEKSTIRDVLRATPIRALPFATPPHLYHLIYSYLGLFKDNVLYWKKESTRGRKATPSISSIIQCSDSGSSLYLKTT